MTRNAEADRHSPQRRQEALQETKNRRIAEPAAAPFEADGEAGNATGRYAGEPVPKDEDGRPVDPAKEAEKEPGTRGEGADLRIGPGDAGAQRSPKVLPRDAKRRSQDSWRRVAGIVAAALVIGLLLLLIA